MENTLREICTAVGVSRRAVQGYEKLNLVMPTGKNERGYLLYDTDAQQRIKQIKMFQDFGFALKDIKEIIDAPNDVLKSALEERKRKMLSDRERMEVQLRQVEALIHMQE